MTPPYTQREHDNAILRIWVVAALVVLVMVRCAVLVGYWGV